MTIEELENQTASTLCTDELVTLLIHRIRETNGLEFVSNEKMKTLVQLLALHEIVQNK